jgi:hypothetical protein
VANGVRLPVLGPTIVGLVVENAMGRGVLSATLSLSSSSPVLTPPRWVVAVALDACCVELVAAALEFKVG